MSDEVRKLISLVDTPPDEFLESIETMTKHAEAIAKMRRKFYLAYIEEGFTEEQALTLCSEFP